MSNISKSVGKGGKNEEADVMIVQELLNKFTKLGGYSQLKEDGKVGKKTLAAIAAFQLKVVKMARPDKLVNPGGATIKKLNENPTSVAKEAKENEKKAEDGGAGSGKGKVTGNTSGVKKYILDFLQAVADHYGKEIYVTSGLRDKNDQARIMWKYWTKTLDRGEKYVWLRANDKVRQQLDDWWTEGHKKDGDSSCEGKFKSKVVEIAESLSRHLRGQAVDIATNVDEKVLKVLEMHMHFVEETDPEGKTSGLHFDDGKGKKPPSVITDAIKAKWPPK